MQFICKNRYVHLRLLDRCFMQNTSEKIAIALRLPRSNLNFVDKFAYISQAIFLATVCWNASFWFHKHKINLQVNYPQIGYGIASGFWVVLREYYRQFCMCTLLQTSLSATASKRHVFTKWISGNTDNLGVVPVYFQFAGKVTCVCVYLCRVLLYTEFCWLRSIDKLLEH